ncbi:cytochrome-c peroxidase [Sphingobacterium thalpophilum]|uniref:cytochrome-c peroxidase n=1 Tax=Sphingobacterium thalpophilum TaxID=259 RepID=UPI0024A6BDF8|nr:cytochrome c peroxidase [Sphingobacterium thalpophilum]
MSWRKALPYIVLLQVPLLLFCFGRQTVPEPFVMNVPEGFPVPEMDTENPMTVEGVRLGKALFIDKRLSVDNTISCASCHHPEKAFTDGLPTSLGVSGKKLPRNSPTLFNLAWNPNGFFWDGGAETLESQAYGPIIHADEMGMDLDTLLHRLRKDNKYVSAFRRVFGDSIQSQYIVRALAQYERSLVAADSRYDQFRKGDKSAFSAIEHKGLILVNQYCRSCHAGELFTDQQFHNNGLDSTFSNEDEEGVYQGRYRITYRKEDLGKYRTPTLRNVALTAPYMHDGRFGSLEEVLNHYQSGIHLSTTLDDKLINENDKTSLALMENEKHEIIAFLMTLTEKRLINE